jgi:hypothetical protein
MDGIQEARMKWKLPLAAFVIATAGFFVEGQTPD